MAFLLSPTERQSDWRATHPYQRQDKIMTLATLLFAILILVCQMCFGGCLLGWWLAFSRAG